MFGYYEEARKEWLVGQALKAVGYGRSGVEAAREAVACAEEVLRLLALDRPCGSEKYTGKEYVYCTKRGPHTKHSGSPERGKTAITLIEWEACGKE